MKILLADAKRRNSLDNRFSPPLGLLYLASTVREALGAEAEVRVLDTSLAQDPLTATRHALEETSPDLVGIRSVDIDSGVLHSVARLSKQISPSVPVVAGGPYPSSSPEDVLRNDSVDCVVLREGERAFVQLVEKISRGEPYAELDGLAQREDNGNFRAVEGEFLSDLDQIAFPAYDLIDLDDYTHKYNQAGLGRGRKYANILTSRGCPFRCTFCHNMFGKKIRFRSADNVFKEIRMLVDDYGVEEIHIIDDSFNLRKTRAKALMRKIIEAGLDLRIAFPNGLRGDAMDTELIDLLVEAGTYLFTYAIETSSQRLQRFVQKDLDLSRARRAIEYTSEKGVLTQGFFMLGFPTEIEVEAEDTVKFAVDSPLNLAFFSTVTIQPDTELYRYALSRGYEPVPRNLLSHYDVKEGLYEFPPERLEEIINRAYQEFYFSLYRLDLNARAMPRFIGEADIQAFYDGLAERCLVP